MKLTLDNMREACAVGNQAVGAHPFLGCVKEEHGIIIFNYAYQYPGIFDADPRLRECRGLVFSVDGELLSRPYHKFFNLGEADESKHEALDFSAQHHVLEKLDGSMIRPLKLKGEIVAATKMGPTDVAAQTNAWVKSRANHVSFWKDMINQGLTPLSEWCSRLNRVVIDYPEPQLVLTGVRDNESGGYLPYSELVAIGSEYGIEVVKAYDLNAGDRSSFMRHMKGLTDLEGYVLRWHDGHMVKIKADEYLKVHGTLDILRSERNLILHIVEGTLDDVMGRLRSTDVDIVNKFHGLFRTAVEESAREAVALVKDQHDKLLGNRKWFAMDVAKSHPHAWLLWVLWDKVHKGFEGDLTEFAIERINAEVSKRAQQSKRSFEKTRSIFGGLRWDSYWSGFNPVEQE